MQTTIFDSFREFTVLVVGRLNMNIVRFFIQLALFALAPAILCSMAYVRNIRVLPVQISLCVMGWLTVFCLPVESLEIYNAMARLWILTACLLVIIFVPPFLGFLMSPNPGGSQNVTRTLYIAIAVLTLLQFLKGGV